MRRLLTLLFLTLPLPAQWQLQQSHTTANLRGIHAIGNGVAWASGSKGTILRTTDNGQIWQPCTTPPGAEALDFRGIQAFDAQTAIVMSSGKGDLSRLYKTMDGCKTWKLIFSNPDPEGFWDAVSLEGNNGSLLGDPVNESFTLFETSDGGTSWVRQKNKGLHALPDQQGAFAASNSSLYQRFGFLLFGAGGLGGARIYSMSQSTVCLDDCPMNDMNSDGHLNVWRVDSLQGLSTPSSGIYSIAGNIAPGGMGSQTIVAVGGDYLSPNAPNLSAALRQGGKANWTSATTPPHGYRSAVAYSPATKSWITVGPNGTDLSTDDGRNWRALRPSNGEASDSDKQWNALSLPFVVGPKGRIGILRPEALHKP